MKRVSARGESQPGFTNRAGNLIFQPGLKYELGHVHLFSCVQKSLQNAFLQIFAPNFKHCTRAEIRHVIATKFQPAGRSEITAQAEIRHVIGPLAQYEFDSDREITIQHQKYNTNDRVKIFSRIRFHHFHPTLQKMRHEYDP